MILKHMDTVKPTFLKMTYGILLILFCTTKNPTRMSFEQKKMKSMCIVNPKPCMVMTDVREGTLINAIAVENIVKLWRKLLEGTITVFLEK